MNKITQTMRYRQALLQYTEKYGVTKAAIRYRTNRQYIYRWKKRYDGTLQSLADRSHRPRSHRKDNEEFYASHKFYSFSDFKSQLARRQRQYNDFPIRPLDWRSPKQALLAFPISVTHH